MAVAHGARVRAADIFAQGWEPLIRSHLAELPAGRVSHPSVTRVVRLIRRFAATQGIKTEGAGTGVERHVATD